jgi:heme exporter protein A
MDRVTFQASGLKKIYNRRTIFSDINFNLERAQSLSVAGRNGAGKSTLLKILAGVLSHSGGTVVLKFDGEEVHVGDHFQYIGFVAPYLQLYDEFTAFENLDIFRKVRRINVTDPFVDELFQRVNLALCRNDFVRTFSSGMKQRLKYACALLHRPQVLLLDEPTANLDAEGRAMVHEIVQEQKRNGIVIVATNEAVEIPWCEQVIDLDMQAQQCSMIA